MSAVLAEVTTAAARTLVSVPKSEPGFEARPRVGGKFLFAGGQKLWVRGVTYGTFRPRADGDEYPDDTQLERDFAAMRANAVKRCAAACRAPTTRSESPAATSSGS